MKRSRNVTLSTAFLGLAATLATTAACAQADEVAYCADEQRYIAESAECERDDPNNPYFIYYGYWGGYRYGPGSQLDQSRLQGRVKAGDATARTKAGLPARGGFGGNGAKFTPSGG